MSTNRGRRRIWTDEQVEFVMQLADTKTPQQIVELFNARFLGSEINPTQVRRIRLYYGRKATTRADASRTGDPSSAVPHSYTSDHSQRARIYSCHDGKPKPGTVAGDRTGSNTVDENKDDQDDDNILPSPDWLPPFTEPAQYYHTPGMVAAWFEGLHDGCHIVGQHIHNANQDFGFP